MKNHPVQRFGAAGSQLWDSVIDVLVLDAHEERLLTELCRTADQMDELQAIVERDGVLSDSSQGVRAHPALQELRQQRIAFARLLTALGLPSGIHDAKDRTRKRHSRPVRGVYKIARRMKWRHDTESIVARTPDDPIDDVLSTINYAHWPDSALNSRAAAGLPTRCDPDKPRCRLIGRCRLCGALPDGRRAVVR